MQPLFRSVHQHTLKQHWNELMLQNHQSELPIDVLTPEEQFHANKTACGSFKPHQQETAAPFRFTQSCHDWEGD